MAGWDKADDLPVLTLAAAAGWDASAIGRCRQLFDSLTQRFGSVDAAALASVLVAHEVTAAEAQHVHRALCRASAHSKLPPRPPALSWEEFAIGMMALDPNTPHAGHWNGLRAQLIFRRYDTSADGTLTPAELEPLIAAIRVAFETPPLPSAVLTQTAHELHATLLAEAEEPAAVAASAGTASLERPTTVTLDLFRTAVGSLRLRG